MPLWTGIVLVGLGLAGVGAGSAVWYGTRIWDRTTAGLIDSMTEPLQRTPSDTVRFTDLDQLPEPVARYLKWALRDGQPIIRSVRMTQTGMFLAKDSPDGWRPFEATQFFVAKPPGFVWDARIQMAPLTTARVRDAYTAGKGSMRVKLFSLFPLVDEQDKAELDSGALMRYLAEAMWFPTALLPSQGVRWTAIDSTSARATLTDSHTAVSLDFHFGPNGEITGVNSPGRYYREADGNYVLMPWAGRVRAYGERGGMRIPVEVDVEWQYPDRNVPYWKGKIGEVEYTVAP